MHVRVNWLYGGYGVLTGMVILALAMVDRHGRTYDMTQVWYLVVMSVIGTAAVARLERGVLNLGGILSQTAALTLLPGDAAVVGGCGVIGAMLRRQRVSPILEPFGAALFTTAGAGVRILVNDLGVLPIVGVLVTVTTVAGANWVVTAIGMRVLTGEPVLSIWRRIFNRSWFLAFGYFALAGILMAAQLDGTLRGYALATIVGILSLALTDTIAGRRTRVMLEEQLSDADRHLIYSRALEGVVHNLRNHVASIQGYLQEIDISRLDRISRQDIMVVRSASDDAADVLRNLAAGATPKVVFASEPLDLNLVGEQAANLVRVRARQAGVQVRVRSSRSPVAVRGDPIQLREVVTNLLLNSIDAVPTGGTVTVLTGWREERAYLSVVDDGPGIADELRGRLFEPHLTTKAQGSGMGLFTSYGIVREHQGELLYEGSRRGAVFTLVLPPYLEGKAPGH